MSQSAFVRGFIDDSRAREIVRESVSSQSAFVRGFIDDAVPSFLISWASLVSIRVRARLHR